MRAVNTIFASGILLYILMVILKTFSHRTASRARLDGKYALLKAGVPDTSRYYTFQTLGELTTKANLVYCKDGATFVVTLTGSSFGLTSTGDAVSFDGGVLSFQGRQYVRMDDSVHVHSIA